MIADALVNPQHGEKALDSLRVADRLIAAGYRKSAEPDATIWGVKVHPEDRSVINGTWDSWEILSYGSDQTSAASVSKGYSTRTLMKKVGLNYEWVEA